MKKYLNGKCYDTKTAKELYGWSNELPQSDFNYHAETLFKKRTGEYFLHFNYVTSEYIRPCNYAGARAWAEAHCDADSFEEIFGIPEEGNEYLSISLPADVAAKARAIASEHGLNLSQYFRSLIENQ